MVADSLFVHPFMTLSMLNDYLNVLTAGVACQEVLHTFHMAIYFLKHAAMLLYVYFIITDIDSDMDQSKP
jgi:hypothetical protein